MPTIPRNLLPAPGQIPSYVRSDSDLRRFQLVFAIGRRICGRDDPLFNAQLFHSDLLTDDPDPGGQLRLEL